MDTDTFDVLLAGNNLTTLVAASELIRSGQRIAVVNPHPSWGGHFTRLTVAGYSFDPGAISHELTTFNDEGARDPLEYDPRKRNDVGRFIRRIEDFTRSHVELVPLDPPSTVFGGRLHPDIVMTNRLDLLRHPDLEVRAEAELRALSRSADDALHPRNKKESPTFLERSYQEASLRNHGATLHFALFEPMFHKMSGLSSERLMALYHRIAWLPLYYPETLLSQFGDEPQVLKDTRFWYPRLGSMGALAEALVARLEAAAVPWIHDPILSLEAQAGRSRLRLGSGRMLESKHLVWSLSHDSLLQATGESYTPLARWSLDLIFGLVARRRLRRSFSVLYSPDNRTLFYRTCNQSHSAGIDEDPVRLVIEVNPDYARAQGLIEREAILARVALDLASLDLLEHPAHLEVAGTRHLQDVLLLPSRENWIQLERERDVLLERYPGVHFTRNVEAFFTDTLNDQIIKGLKLAAQLGERKK